MINLDEQSRDELIALCKKHNVSYHAKKKNELITELRKVLYQSEKDELQEIKELTEQLSVKLMNYYHVVTTKQRRSAPTLNKVVKLIGDAKRTLCTLKY